MASYLLKNYLLHTQKFKNSLKWPQKLDIEAMLTLTATSLNWRFIKLVNKAVNKWFIYCVAQLTPPCGLMSKIVADLTGRARARRGIRPAQALLGCQKNLFYN